MLISGNFCSVRFRSVPDQADFGSAGSVPKPVPPVPVPLVLVPTQKMQKTKLSKTDPYKPFQDFSLSPSDSSRKTTPIDGLKIFLGVF